MFQSKKTEYVKDSITKEKEKITTSFIRRDENGLAIRIESDIQRYGINVDFAAVDEVDYEEQVDRKLAQKLNSQLQNL